MEKKIRISRRTIIIIIIVIGSIILLGSMNMLLKKDERKSDKEENLLLAETDFTEDEELTEVTDKDKEGLEYYYSESPLLRYNFDEEGNIISEDEGEREIMTEEEFEEGFEESLRKIQTQSKDIPLLGTWTILDPNGQLSEGNYIRFNSDGTFEKSGKDENGEVIVYGKYIYAIGGKNESTGQIERMSKGFRWYDVVLQPTNVVRNGETITEELKTIEYILGIGVENERQMVKENYSQYAFIKTAR